MLTRRAKAYNSSSSVV